MPYDITLKAHVQFNATSCSFQGTASKAEKVGKVVCAISNQDQHAALLTDYDWYAGQGDALEIVQGKVWYHVGFCDREDELPTDARAKLTKVGHGEAQTMRR